jgi:hypothetical protein
LLIGPSELVGRVWVKRFQAIDVTRRFVLLFGIGAKALCVKQGDTFLGSKVKDENEKQALVDLASLGR